MLLNLSILIGLLFALILAISKWKVHPFIALIITGLVLGLSLGMGQDTVDILLKGFSETLRWIAVIVIVGAFIGEVLQETGGAMRIAQRVVQLVGERKLPWAMGITGYIISIPVFVDVAYILLQPVTESLAARSKTPVLYLGLCLTAGLTVAHTLIPPTPGPLAVASLLNLDLGSMLGVNIFVGIFAMGGGIIFAMLYLKNSWLAYDETLQAKYTGSATDTEEVIPTSRAVIVDILPILVPILLIGAGSFVSLDEAGIIGEVFQFITIPLVAVFIGALLAAFQIKSKNKQSVINGLVESAIVKSALVIMITGAGGALGYIIKQSEIQGQIVEVFSAIPFLGIILPFLLASILTISTGSITVSLVGTASVLGPMVDSLPISPELTAAMIGCGAFCVFHANSSFFWLLNRLHNVPPTTLYRTYTVQSLVMGLSGLIGVFILYLLGF